MRISDWSSDVCSSDLVALRPRGPRTHDHRHHQRSAQSVPHRYRMRPAVVALACLHCLLPSVSAGVIPSTANPVAEPEPADAPGGEIPTFAGLSGNDCRPLGYLRRPPIPPGVVGSPRTGAPDSPTEERQE